MFRQELAKHRVVLDTFQFLGDDAAGLCLDTFVVFLHDLFHVIRPVLVREVGNLWYLLVPGRFMESYGSLMIANPKHAAGFRLCWSAF